MWSLRLLLGTLVVFSDVGVECFIIQGKHLEIALQDVYFLTGLPMLGVIGDTPPKLSHGDTLDDVYKRHFYASANMHGSYILICDVEILLT